MLPDWLLAFITLCSAAVPIIAGISAFLQTQRNELVREQRKELDGYANRLEKAERDNILLQREHEDNTREISGLHREIAEELRKNVQLTARVERMRVEHEKVVKELVAKAATDKRADASIIEGLRAELRIARDHTKEWQDKAARWQHEAEQAQHDLEQQRTAVRKMETETIPQLQQTVERLSKKVDTGPLTAPEVSQTQSESSLGENP